MSGGQASLFDYTPTVILGDRSGETYEPKRDRERLDSQAGDVFRLMQDGCWRTLREISERTKWPEASISARLRDFRSPKFGGFTVERRHLSKGLHQYRVLGKVE